MEVAEFNAFKNNYDKLKTDLVPLIKNIESSKIQEHRDTITKLHEEPKRWFLIGKNMIQKNGNMNRSQYIEWIGYGGIEAMKSIMLIVDVLASLIKEAYAKESNKKLKQSENTSSHHKYKQMMDKVLDYNHHITGSVLHFITLYSLYDGPHTFPMEKMKEYISNRLTDSRFELKEK